MTSKPLCVIKNVWNKYHCYYINTNYIMHIRNNCSHRVTIYIAVQFNEIHLCNLWNKYNCIVSKIDLLIKIKCLYLLPINMSLNEESVMKSVLNMNKLENEIERSRPCSLIKCVGQAFFCLPPWFRLELGPTVRWWCLRHSALGGLWYVAVIQKLYSSPGLG